MKTTSRASKALSLILAVIMVMTILTAAGVHPLAAAGENDLVISECDTKDGWNKAGGDKTLYLDANGYNSTSAIRSQVDGGAFRTITYTLPAPLDISNHTSIEWDAMFHTQSGNNPGTMWEQIQAAYGAAGGTDNLYLRITTATGGYRVYYLPQMQTAVRPAPNASWVHFTVDLNTYFTENDDAGIFDATQLTSFYFCTTEKNPVDSTVNNGFIRLDNINATGYKAPTAPDVVLSECETVDNWSFAGKEETFSVGLGFSGNSLRIEGGTGILRALTYTAPTPHNLAGLKAVEWNMTALAVGTILDQWAIIADEYSDDVGVQISDGVNTVTYSLFDMQITKVNNDWWHFAVDLSDTSLNLSNITSFMIYIKKDGTGNSAIANTIYKLDNLIATSNTVTPNGYDYARVTDMLLDNCSSEAGWSYRGDPDHNLLTENGNGYEGGAIQVYADFGKIGPLQRTFTAPVSVHRHAALSFKVRCMTPGVSDDRWPTVLAGYKDYIQVTLTDAGGASHIYGYSDLIIEPDKNSWYTITVRLGDAKDIDLTKITAFGFRLTDTYQNEALPSVNFRIDNLGLLVAAPVQIIAGDANGDGLVDLKDLVRLKKYTVDDSAEIIIEAVDFDKNETLDAADIIVLRKILLGIPVEVTPAAYANLSAQGWGTIVKP